MNNKGFIGLVGLIVTAAILCFMVYFVLARYLGNPSARMDQPTKRAVEESGIDLGTQASVLESTKSKIKEIEDLENKRADDLMNR